MPSDICSPSSQWGNGSDTLYSHLCFPTPLYPVMINHCHAIFCHLVILVKGFNDLVSRKPVPSTFLSGQAQLIFLWPYQPLSCQNCYLAAGEATWTPLSLDSRVECDKKNSGLREGVLLPGLSTLTWHLGIMWAFLDKSLPGPDCKKHMTPLLPNSSVLQIYYFPMCKDLTDEIWFSSSFHLPSK